MIKFKWFKSSFNLTGKQKRESYDKGTETISVRGAYRSHKNDFFDNLNYSETSIRPTPSMVKLPPSAQRDAAVKPFKSTNDLSNSSNNYLPVTLRKSTLDISHDPRGGETTRYRDSTDTHKNSKRASKENRRQKEQKLEKQRLAEQKKIEKLTAQEQEKKEKQRLAEQKKREKLEAQEQAKQEKLRKEREKQAAKQQTKETKHKKEARDSVKKKTTAPLPLQEPVNPLTQTRPQYSTNTLESSISRSSGPPPYSEEPKPELQKVKNWSDSNGNVSFAKTFDNAGTSWDMISQHRQQVSRPVSSGAGGKPKQMVMDLNFNFGNTSAKPDYNSDV